MPTCPSTARAFSCIGLDRPDCACVFFVCVFSDRTQCLPDCACVFFVCVCFQIEHRACHLHLSEVPTDLARLQLTFCLTAGRTHCNQLLSLTGATHCNQLPSIFPINRSTPLFAQPSPDHNARSPFLFVIARHARPLRADNRAAGGPPDIARSNPAVGVVSHPVHRYEIVSGR
jgi:hypothetical protein